MRLSIVLLSLLLPCSFSLHILVYHLLVGKSHLNHVSTLINMLTDHNHTVDLIVARFNSAITSNGTHKASKIIVVSFDGTSPWNKRASHLHSPFDSEKSIFPYFFPFSTFYDVDAELCELVLSSHEVNELLNGTEYDAALISGYDLCPHALVHRYNVQPVMTYVATELSLFQVAGSGVPRLPIYVTGAHPPTNWLSSFWIRLCEFAVQFNMFVSTPYREFERFDALFQSFYGPDFPSSSLLVQNVSYDFVNSNQLIDLPRAVGPKAKFIGGAAERNPPKKVNEQFDEILSRRPAGSVLLAFGTQVSWNLVPMHITRTFLSVFEKFVEYTFIWKYDGPSLEVNETSNVVLVEWIPQVDLLRDPRVVGFISHSGLNSLTESAYAGVPLLAIPLFADQMHNAFLAQRRGFGVVLDKEIVSEETLTKALDEILHQPTYRVKAKEVAAELAASPEQPEQVFIQAVEYAAKFKNLHEQLNLPSTGVPFYIHYSWDIFLFFLLSAVCSASAVAFIVISTFRLLNRIVIVKQKVH